MAHPDAQRTAGQADDGTPDNAGRLGQLLRRNKDGQRHEQHVGGAVGVEKFHHFGRLSRDGGHGLESEKGDCIADGEERPLGVVRSPAVDWLTQAENTGR